MLSGKDQPKRPRCVVRIQRRSYAVLGECSADAASMDSIREGNLIFENTIHKRDHLAKRMINPVFVTFGQSGHACQNSANLLLSAIAFLCPNPRESLPICPDSFFADTTRFTSTV